MSWPLKWTAFRPIQVRLTGMRSNEFYSEIAEQLPEFVPGATPYMEVRENPDGEPVVDGIGGLAE